MIKPKKLNPGDQIAAVSLSYGGAGKYPNRYEIGKRQFEEKFGVTVVESEHALRDPEWLSRNPKARANDLMAAFADSEISGIISNIGGDDSIRILPYLDLNIIRKNPKVFMGYSDTTMIHAACFKAGLASFYGPMFMAGFAENGGMFPYMEDSVRQTLFSDSPIGEIKPNHMGWTVEFLDWAVPENQSRKRELNPCTGWNFQQKHGFVEGILFGGCVESLEYLRGTPYWPSNEQLDGSILFLETSEEAPPPSILVRFVRSLACMNTLDKLSGIVLGRPGGPINPDKFCDYENALVDTVRNEFNLTDMPMVTNLDFGHTDPMFVMPIGASVCINSIDETISINESAVY